MDPDVSRETPSTPDVARRAFPSARIALAERYAHLLATDGVVRGLIGPREAPRLWDRHLVNCSLLGRLIPEGAVVCDIGSGAGLPGLVLAIARPDLRITLVEPLLRRTTFLEEVASSLGLQNVEVVRGRADVLHGVRTFDVVTSRAVAPLDRLLGWSMPLVGARGELVAMKGSSVADEIEAARVELGRWGCTEPQVALLGEDWPVSPTVAVRVAWADPSRVSWPLASGPGRAGSTGRRAAGRGRSTSKRRRTT
jgi:16S rRNA (guanine527-N7)-methyltransferase